MSSRIYKNKYFFLIVVFLTLNQWNKAVYAVEPVTGLCPAGTRLSSLPIATSTGSLLMNVTMCCPAGHTLFKAKKASAGTKEDPNAITVHGAPSRFEATSSLLREGLASSYTCKKVQKPVDHKVRPTIATCPSHSHPVVARLNAFCCPTGTDLALFILPTPTTPRDRKEAREASGISGALTQKWDCRPL